MLAFDLETTGTDPRTCKIVTSALVRLTEQGKDSTIMLANPGVEILAAARIAWVMARHYRELTEKSGEELMELQAVAYYQYKKNLQQYLTEKGKDTSDFTFGWPMD